MTEWAVERITGSAAALHGREALGDPHRRITVLDVDAPAIVLGSTQRVDVVDTTAAARRDVEVVRRRTGGGAVYLEPGSHVWIDVVIPVNDPLWRDDVATAFGWLGDAWASAIRDRGVIGEVHRAAVCHSILGRLVCFAGLGFGEVTVDGRKAVGLAQRRTRDGAWFQGAVLRRWDVEPYRELLAPGLAALTEDPTAELDAVAVCALDTTPAHMADALLAALPA
jgi:lipoate-protein ligase A